MCSQYETSAMIASAGGINATFDVEAENENAIHGHVNRATAMRSGPSFAPSLSAASRFADKDPRFLIEEPDRGTYCSQATTVSGLVLGLRLMQPQSLSAPHHPTRGGLGYCRLGCGGLGRVLQDRHGTPELRRMRLDRGGWF